MSDGARRDGEPSTRRAAMRAMGGGALALLGLAGFGEPVIATQATPVAGQSLVGAYVVVRVRRMRPDYSATELARIVGEGFLPIVREIPGFVAYFVVADDERGTWASVNVFEDRAGGRRCIDRAGRRLRRPRHHELGRA